MTPQETVQTTLDAYARRDLAAALAQFDPDLDFSVHPTNSEIKLCGCFKGLQAFQEHLVEIDRYWSFETFEPLEVIASGNRVAARIRVELVRKDTGERFETEIANFMTVVDGRITSLQEFRDTAALERAVPA